MDHSPGRELRNRVKQSPNSSPTAARTKSSPNSSPQQVKGQTHLPNGVLKPKTLTIPIFNPNIVMAGNQIYDLINVDNQEGELANENHSTMSCDQNTKSTSANMFHQNTTKSATTSFPKPNIFIDNLTMNVLTNPGTVHPGAVQVPRCVKSLDINSNMDTKVDKDIPSATFYSVPVTNGKRSRKQSSPKRARTASNSPAHGNSSPTVPSLWEDKLEMTPSQPRKRPRKISYVAISDSPSDVIDLTLLTTPETDVPKINDLQSSSPLSYQSVKITQKSHSNPGTTVKSSSPMRCQSPRACKFNEKSNKTLDKRASAPSVMNWLSSEIERKTYSPKRNASPSRNYSPRRGLKRAASNSPKVDNSSPQIIRARKAQDSPRNQRFRTLDGSTKTRALIPGRGRGRKVLDIQDNIVPKGSRGRRKNILDSLDGHKERRRRSKKDNANINYSPSKGRPRRDQDTDYSPSKDRPRRDQNTDYSPSKGRPRRDQDRDYSPSKGRPRRDQDTDYSPSKGRPRRDQNTDYSPSKGRPSRDQNPSDNTPSSPKRSPRNLIKENTVQISPCKSKENSPNKNSGPQITNKELVSDKNPTVCRKLDSEQENTKNSHTNFLSTFMSFLTAPLTQPGSKKKTPVTKTYAMSKEGKVVRVENNVSSANLNSESLVKNKGESPTKTSSKESPAKTKLGSPAKTKVESPAKMKVESPAKSKVESPVKLKIQSPVKVKVEPCTPTLDEMDQSKLLNMNSTKDNNSASPSENETKRRIVRPRKKFSRQRKNSGGRGRHSTGRRKKVSTSPCKFQQSQEVLARWYDGLFYLGSVIKVDERGRKCFVKFEDDSEYWILFKDLQKGAKEGDVSCCLCQTDSSDTPNEIVLCDNCGLGYHQQCHYPNIHSEVLQPDVEWCCRLCVFAAAVKKGGALKNGPDAKALQNMKQTFPYDINKLTWDAQHKTNVEQCYCYCGGPGNWFLKMLQCCRCRQWYHEACIQCLEYPLMNGDRFYLFVCSHCNTGPEYIKRLDLKWVDVVHLTLYNLTIEGRWNKFYDVDDIKNFITSNWEMLQVDALSEDKECIREKVISSLERYKSRFVNQKENRRKSLSKPGSYGLRVRIPPPAPTVMLPHTGQVNHEIMMSLKEKGKNVKCFVPTQCTSPVSMPWQNKQRGLEMDVSIAFKSDKIRKSLLLSNDESSNQDYKGYSGCSLLPPDSINQSLDTLIPPPNNFEGFNHPFKNFFEQEEELAHFKRKNEIINYLYMNYEGDAASQTSVESTLSVLKDDPTQSIPTPPPSVTSGNYAQESKTIPSRGRKRKANDTPAEPSRYSKRKRVSATYYNVVDTQAIESVKYQQVSMSQIKNNMCQYFGAADRLKKGEKYHVYGKHVTTDGKIQYLIQWDGLQTK